MFVKNRSGLFMLKRFMFLTIVQNYIWTVQNETIVLFVFIGDFVSVYIRVIIREPINLLTNSINVSSLSTYIEARLFQSKGIME